MMDLISLVSRKIEEAASRILNADFDINPKIIDKKNIGCKYCKYKDICYLKEEDKIYINTSS
jgi:ATP-dependent helicase/DNAse subunit B